MIKCPSSTWCWDLNSQHSNYESPALTTRSGLLPKNLKAVLFLRLVTYIVIRFHFFLLMRLHLQSKFSRQQSDVIWSFILTRLRLLGGKKLLQGQTYSILRKQLPKANGKVATLPFKARPTAKNVNRSITDGAYLILYLIQVSSIKCFLWWHCHTTSHSSIPHPTNRARRWYTVVRLTYDLCQWPRHF